MPQTAQRQRAAIVNSVNVPLVNPPPAVMFRVPLKLRLLLTTVRSLLVPSV